MKLEIIAPVVLLIIAAVVLVRTQLLIPKLARKRFAEELIRRGWTEKVDPEDPEWKCIMTLAIEENQGPETIREDNDKIGPFRMRSKHTTKRTGKTLKVYRDTETNLHRYAAVGKKIEKHERRSSPFPLSSWKRYSYTLPEIWIGEARRIPARSPEVAFNWFNAAFGSTARKFAITKGIDPETIPDIALPVENNPTRAIREILRESSLASALKAKVYIGPRSWVMSIPLNHVKKRSQDIVDLAQKISETLDRVSLFVWPTE